MAPGHPIVVAIATIILASPLSAQAGDSLVHPVLPGDVVRLQENGRAVVHGILLRRDSSGLVVADRRTRDTVYIPLVQITRAEVQHGSHRRGASAVGSGAAVGAVAGGLIFGLTIASAKGEERALGIYVAGFAAAVTTAIGTAAGILASFTETETWVGFDPTAVPVQTLGAPQ